MNRTDQNLKDAIATNERRALWGAAAVIFGLVLEVIFASAFHEPPETVLSHWGPVVADALVALGVAGEVLFGRKSRIDSEELTRRSEERLAEAHAQAGEAIARAAEANKVAEEERHTRVRLEAQLQPRTLNQEQIELIQGLRATFNEINLAREVDIETHMFAQDIAVALMSAGIIVHQYRRAADVHTAGIQIYDPLGFDNSGPKSVGPLRDVFRKIDPNVIGIAGPMPPDIPASSKLPMIIVGGRFVLPYNSPAIMDLLRQLDTMNPNNKAQDSKGKND
jgi:hypothetical protein